MYTVLFHFLMFIYTNRGITSDGFIEDAAFQETAQAAKAGCPISLGARRRPEITLDATLEAG